MRNIWVWDIESYPNFFCAVFIHVDTDEVRVFEISDRKSEAPLLRQFLNTRPQLIGFNNLNYDYPVIHNTILRFDCGAGIINAESNRVIGEKYSSIWDSDTICPQLDLFKIWHYDNKNKATSLKWLEFAMRSEDVRDLPYPPGTVLTNDQMQNTIEYCIHDVRETKKFYQKSLKHIKLRQFYSDQEGMNLMNTSEISLSKKLFAKYLAPHMGITPKELRDLKTLRRRIEVSDVIFPYITFKHKENIDVYNYYANAVWTPGSKLNKTIKYYNVKRTFAEGGLHSFGKAADFNTTDTHVLVDVDFASYYPHLSFRNNLGPEHIPRDIFNRIYEGFYHERKKYPKSDPRNYVLKIILNGSYGLSKDQYSFLFDTKWQLAITINGQLILAMLTEAVMEACPDTTIVFENTDGCMYYIKREYYDNLVKACKEVEQIVNIPLELQICERAICRDVNNYINIIEGDYVKFKGAFEIDRDYHKNHSKRIVPLALANYYINGVSPEDTIYNHLNGTSYTFAENYGIFDFCIGAKMKGKNSLVARNYDLDVPLARMNRYYVSNRGIQLVKILPPLPDKKTKTQQHKEKVDPSQMDLFDYVPDVQIQPDRESELEAGYFCTLFNKYTEGPYDLNFNYYIDECYKVIKKIGKHEV